MSAAPSDPIKAPSAAATSRNAGVVLGATFASRILGYLRDMLIAWSFGAGFYADAFVVAFRLPNLFRRLVGEGALGMAFIPVFHHHARSHGRRAAIDLSVVAFQRLAGFLVPTVALATLLAPVIVRGLAPGFASSEPQLVLTVQLTRIMMPYVLLVGLVALSMAVLNALGHFTAPALAPAALNMAMIAAMGIGVWLAPAMSQRIGILAAGVLVGGILQLALQVPALRRNGVVFWRAAHIKAGVFKAFGKAALPVMLGGATYQVNVLLGTLLASFLASGSVSYLFYADRLVQFPLGLFAVSAVTVIMPDLARQAASGRPDDVKKTLQQALRLVSFVTVPAMVGLIVLREPVVALLFERGAFGSDSTRLTAEALLWYGVGLWGYAALRILLAVCYALQDTLRPLKAAAVGALANLGIGVGLMPFMGHGGIALGASIAAALNVLLLAKILRGRLGALGFRVMAPAAARTLACALVMGGVVHWLDALAAAVLPGGTAVAVARLVACIIAGLLVYLGASFIVRSPELDAFWRMVFGRKQRA